METTTPTPKPKLDLDKVQERLANAKGRQYWRGLEEIAETQEFQAWMDDEFPNRESLKGIDRRTLLKYMGASLALAGLSGCRGLFLPQTKVVPYVRAPEELVYGKPLFYASIYTQGGYAKGILVEQHEGRPTKIEGNPDHPASLGATDPFMQASILTLYDPDRTQNVTQQGDISTWETFIRSAQQALADAQGGGTSVRILSENITSPSLGAEIKRFLAANPNSQWHQWESTGQDNLTKGAIQAFGKPVHTYYDFKPAKVVVSLDAEYLMSMPGSLRYSRDVADGRRVQGKSGTMNRLYAFESMPTITGTFGDHRFATRASEIETVARAIAAGVGVSGAASTAKLPVSQSTIDAIVKDLQANKGASIVLAGQHQPAVVHQLCHSINAALGNAGKTVMYTEPLEVQPVVHQDSLSQLVADMNAGKVSALFILGANPVYTAPSDFKFADAMQKVKFRVQHSLYDDETGGQCEWHLPEAHYLEVWGDAKAYDGTVSVQQPLIQPLFEGKSYAEMLAAVRGAMTTSYDLVRGALMTGGDSKAFEKEWRRWLNSGVVNAPKAPTISVTPSGSIPAQTPPPAGDEIVFQLDPTVWDGRFANNSWLQELPKPLTKVVWDNVVHMSPGTAKRLGNLADEDTVELTYNGQTIRGAAWVLPGHPDNSFTVHLGYGRTRGGTVCEGMADENLGGEIKREPWGFNAYALRTSKAMNIDGGVTVKGVGGYTQIATTQIHHTMKGYDIVRSGGLEQFGKDPSLKPADAEDVTELQKQDLYPDQVFAYNGPQWGMTVDLNMCTGCNACVTACQSENNIPTVGKLQVKKSREMHWLRIDRYYVTEENADENNLANPETVFQPMMCVNCEKAPCEPVCPVAATVHSHEGLNQMVYNRCVGTRYCSNNCPYKVRRFNFLNFSDNQEQFNTQVPPAAREPKTHGIELLRMLNNPDVTVRGRGIMEKCTYCVQRINEARIEGKKLGRDPMDGEITTACQQACPTKTIVFGNIADPKSEVTKWRNDPRAYRVLEELQTRPRTSYLAKLRNPNPEIKA